MGDIACNSEKGSPNNLYGLNSQITPFTTEQL